MGTIAYVEFTVLDFDFTPDHLLSTVMTDVYYPYLKLNRSYQMPRNEILFHIRRHDPFFIFQNGEKRPLSIISIDGEDFLRTDDQKVPQDL